MIENENKIIAVEMSKYCKKMNLDLIPYLIYLD